MWEMIALVGGSVFVSAALAARFDYGAMAAATTLSDGAPPLPSGACGHCAMCIGGGVAAITPCARLAGAAATAAVVDPSRWAEVTAAAAAATAPQRRPRRMVPRPCRQRPVPFDATAVGATPGA